MSKISFIFGTLQNKQSLLLSTQVSFFALISHWPLTWTTISITSTVSNFYTALRINRSSFSHLCACFNVMLQHRHTSHRKQGFGNFKWQRPESCTCQTGMGVIYKTATTANVSNKSLQWTLWIILIWRSLESSHLDVYFQCLTSLYVGYVLGMCLNEAAWPFKTTKGSTPD